MSPEFSVFHYQSPRRLLLDFLAQRQRQEPAYSARRFASDIGISHTLLLMLLQGKRPLRIKHSAALAGAMGLSSHERLFLQALIQFDSATEAEDKALCQLWLTEIHPAGEFRIRELDEFSVIAHWLHTAILAASRIPSLDLSPEALEKRFRKWGKGITALEIRSAIERLLELGLLKRDDSGRLVATHERVTCRDDLANRGARLYHKQASELAAQAIELVPLEQREFQSFSIAVSRDKVPLAKEMLRKFRAQLAKAMSETPGEEIYQVNLQFFQ
ncbi:MAG: TIGR02147 family protein, partial [Oligoflexia bacterium]|nr:TIGR02147 family protein [Oligoflexia bacterium]